MIYYFFMTSSSVQLYKKEWPKKKFEIMAINDFNLVKDFAEKFEIPLIEAKNPSDSR